MRTVNPLRGNQGEPLDNRFGIKSLSIRIGHYAKESHFRVRAPNSVALTNPSRHWGRQRPSDKTNLTQPRAWGRSKKENPMNSLRIPKLLTLLCFGLLLVASLPVVAVAQAADSGANHKVRNIVLVHGAWANGSSWSLVIPLLEARGFHVVAAHMPLTSLKDDDDAVERAIDRVNQTN